MAKTHIRKINNMNSTRPNIFPLCTSHRGCAHKVSNYRRLYLPYYKAILVVGCLIGIVLATIMWYILEVYLIPAAEGNSVIDGDFARSMMVVLYCGGVIQGWFGRVWVERWK